MTRRDGFDIRVAPDAERVLRDLALQRGAPSIPARYVRSALRHLSMYGTRANGTKKLRSLELWEIRAGGHRVYFCPVRGTNQSAVAVVAPKSARKHPMKTLKRIERKAHRWRDKLEEMA